MIKIEQVEETKKWRATVFDKVIGDKYSSAVVAANKVHKYLKGQGYGK